MSESADTIKRLTSAATEVLARQGFAGLTVRLVAAEAGVGAATAYTYFSSKEHLVAEVFWRRLVASPTPAGAVDDDPADRAVAVLRHIALMVADEPEFATAVTTALLSDDPDVEHLRQRVGREIRARLIDALGPTHDPDLVATLQMLYSGALVHAGMGYASYTEIADRLETSARMLFG